MKTIYRVSSYATGFVYGDFKTQAEAVRFAKEKNRFTLRKYAVVDRIEIK